MEGYKTSRSSQKAEGRHKKWFNLAFKFAGTDYFPDRTAEHKHDIRRLLDIISNTTNPTPLFIEPLLDKCEELLR